MVLRSRAVVFPRGLTASARIAACLAACLAGCTPPPLPPAPAVHKILPSPVTVPASRLPAASAPAPRMPAAKAFHVKSILFYQPDAVLKSRLTVGQDAFTAYIGHVERKLSAGLGVAQAAPGFSAALVIALKPGGVSHAWLVSKETLPPGLAASLIAAAQSVPPVAVQGGPIAFAIVFDAFGGGGAPVVDAAHPFPIPLEWHSRVAPSAVQGPQPAPLSQ